MEKQETELKARGAEGLKGDTTEILEEIEVEDLVVDGICGVY